jgi:hypothetical protein
MADPCISNGGNRRIGSLCYYFSNMKGNHQQAKVTTEENLIKKSQELSPFGSGTRHIPYLVREPVVYDGFGSGTRHIPYLEREPMVYDGFRIQTGLAAVKKINTYNQTMMLLYILSVFDLYD